MPAKRPNRRPICPVCGSISKKAKTEYGPRFYCCGLWSWGFRPLVDGATHQARRGAHMAFDVLWKEGHLSRTQAYKFLAERMGLTTAECHMRLMNREQAERVPGIAAEMLEKFRRCKQAKNDGGG